MSSTNAKSYVDAAKIEAVILKFPSLQMTPQAGFLKVAAPETARHYRVYPARTTMVGRVDLSGFTMDHPGLLTLKDHERFGKVSQQVDFSRPEAEVLECLEAVLAHMASLPAPAKPEKAKKEAAPKAKGWSFRTAAADKTPEQLAEEKAKRRALIERVAREKGVAVSPHAA